MTELRKDRSAVDMVSVTFEFSRQHLLPLLKNVLLYVAPPMILAYFMIFRLVGSFFNQAILRHSLPADNLIYWVIFIVFIFFGWVLLYFVVNDYVRQVVDNPGKKPSGPFQSGHFQQQILSYAGVMLVYLFVSIVLGMLAFALPYALFSFGIFVFMFFLLLKYSLVFPAISMENKGIVEAFQRSSGLIKGMWWRSFWFYFFTIWVLYFFGNALNAPLALGGHALEYLNVPNTAGMVSSWLFLVFIFLYYFLISMVTSVLLALSVAVNYYSLKDKHEETFLEQKIHEIDAE